MCVTPEKALSLNDLGAKDSGLAAALQSQLTHARND
jgi:hypothetical protein